MTRRPAIETTEGIMPGSILLVRGDDYHETLTVTRDDGDPYDLTGASLFFTLKVRTSDADEDAVLANESGDGDLTITDEANGEASHTLRAYETEDLAPGVYRYDYQLVAADSTVSTLERGKLLIREDVTRRTT